MLPTPAFWSQRDVCVTGGAGFLGWHLVRTLRAQGARVRILALQPPADHPVHPLTAALPMQPAPPHPGPLPRSRGEGEMPLSAQPSIIADVVPFWGDVRDPSLVRAALAGCSVVFHTAGVVGVWGKVLGRMWSVHVDGTRQVLAGAEPGARIVHTSSITTLGAWPRPKPVREDMPWNRAAAEVPYVQAKRAAERLVLEAAPDRDVVVTNPGYLLGPEDYDHSIMGRLCERFWRGRTPLAPPGGLNLVDVRDAALGHLLAAEHGRRGERYVLGGENRDFPSFFRLLAQVAGMRPRGLPAIPWLAFATLAALAEARAHCSGKEPYPSLAHATMNRFYWYGDSAKAAALGYQARPLRQTLTDTFDWFQARQPFQLRGFNRWWMRPRRAG